MAFVQCRFPVFTLQCFSFFLHSVFYSLGVHAFCDCQQRLLQRPTSTRMPIQTKSTTSTSVTSTSPSSSSGTHSTPKLEIYTSSQNKNENNGPTSTFDDLLNSFQKEPTTTTRRPQLTTFSDADDIAFLKGLVRIKAFLFPFFFLFLFLCNDFLSRIFCLFSTSFKLD